MIAIPFAVILALIAVFLYFRFTKPTVAPFPVAWRPILSEEVLFYSKLDNTEKVDFENRMMHFLSQTSIEGVQTEVEDLDKILIASSAIIPVFRFKNWSYNNLYTVLLYPNHLNNELQFNSESSNKRIAGMVGTGKYNKKMILSKRALRHGFNNKTDKNNTAIHEFVHLIDKIDGNIDGIPQVLIDNAVTIPWLQLVRNKMLEIHENDSDIRKYGGTSEIEFFAVASEYFFERPKLFRRKHPELYKHLSQFFQQKID